MTEENVVDVEAEELPPPKQLAAKLLDAQQSVEAVVKQGQNTDQNYRYAMAADVLGVCRAALHAQGLVPAITHVVVTDRREFTTKSGTKGLEVEVTVLLTITDCESGESTTFGASGAGSDYGGGDKAVLKGQTGATKYAYANALALPFADHDPERDLPGEAGRAPKQQREQRIDKDKIREVAKLMAESREHGVGFERLCVVFTAAGAEAPAIDRKDSREKAVRALTDPQADHILNSLDAIIKTEETPDGEA